LRYLRHSDDAAENTQRALVQALVQIGGFRGEASFRSTTSGQRPRRAASAPSTRAISSSWTRRAVGEPEP